MNLPISPAPTAKIGTCPHGLPPGACPICSGMGGGGGGSTKKADFSAKAGEMSWADCAAIGNMLKAQKLAQKQNEQSFQSQILAAAAFEKGLANIAQKLANFAQNIQASMPAIIAKPLGFIATKLLVPMLNVLKDIPLNIQKTFAKMGEKLTDISDKLNAMFGELKNSIEKKISDKLKDFKKKIKSLFSVLETTETDDEERKIDEADCEQRAKRLAESLGVVDPFNASNQAAEKIFREKTTLHSLKEKMKEGESEPND